MLTTEFLNNLRLNVEIKSIDPKFEYFFLKGETIDVSTQEKADNCNLFLEKLDWLKNVLTDENRKNFANFDQAELAEYTRQSDQAIQFIRNLETAQYITIDQEQDLVHAILNPHIHICAFNFKNFCKTSKTHSMAKIKVNCWTDRTATWDLLPYKVEKK